MSAIDPAVEAHLEATREARLASYLELLRIESISALPEHEPEVRRAAGWLADELRRIGFEHVEVSETAWLPVVCADWLHAADAPTVLVYGHYDVQPVDPIELWETAPFDPFVKDGRVIGRGAADDKGQVHMHLRAAEALLATRGRLPVNIRILFEGEEESTSPSLAAWIRTNQARLAADAVVISDTSFFEGNLPAIPETLRGLLTTQIDVTGPPTDVHSGSYGGTIENPALALARILGELKDRDGVVRIPGFYDGIPLLTDADRARLAALPFDEAEYRERVGVPALAGERGYTTLERKGARPTLDVNGLWSGFQGAGSKTIIPAHAHAKVSMRLVPGQDPLAIFRSYEAFIAQVAPPGVRVEVQRQGTGLPTRTPLDLPLVRAAAAALEATFGRPPLFTREGGSIPVAEAFSTILGLPVVLLGFANPDSNSHAPNESMILDNYETGIRTIVAMWDSLAAGGLVG